MALSPSTSTSHAGFSAGWRQALPIAGGYVPVAIAFGIIATQAGLSPLAATLVSLIIFSGAAQFLLVGLLASGASPWWAAAMALLINLRHVVYGPSLASLLPQHPRLRWLAHGLTDEVMALSSARLPEQPHDTRIGWFGGAILIAWGSWVSGTALGSVAGQWLTAQWPLMNRILPFALPALFLVLIAPRFRSRRWALALLTSSVIGLSCALLGWPNAGIPIAAACGALAFAGRTTTRGSAS